MSQDLCLDEVLAEIARRNLIITRDGKLWSSNTHVPRAIRHAICIYRSELVTLVARGDRRLCPTYEHWRYWQEETCEMCLHLEEAYQRVEQERKAEINTTIKSYIRQLQLSSTACPVALLF